MNERQRIEQVMASEKMSANQFAKEIGIQAGTLSNIINGRNNPSLDVLQRVLNRFRTLSSDWLILGIGSMYRPKGEAPDNTLFNIKPIEPEKKPDEIGEKLASEPQNPAVQQTPVAPKTIERVVIFYSDGTFEER
ncbi:MAG: helix-turn-helix transcriptional regulator [Paludibacteraceae bacterium]|nr:helix-turn-helix transcriptional regulator [Paludibacteraceae bacterium]